MSDKAPDINKTTVSGNAPEASGTVSYNHDTGVRIFLQIGTCSIIAGILETAREIRSYIQIHQVQAEVYECGCMGMCSSDPVVDVEISGRAKISLQKLNANAVTDVFDSLLNHILPDNCFILGQYSSGYGLPWERVPFIDDLPFFSLQHRVLLKDAGSLVPVSLQQYQQIGGFDGLRKALYTYSPAAVCDEITQSGLTGRGGGGYSTGAKLKTVLQHHSHKKFLICNADESDPGSFSGRLLIESKPFMLLEGITIAAYASGATEAIIYIRNQYQLAIERLREAIRILYQAHVLGDDIWDSGMHLNISIYESPGAYVCGEETALIENLEANRGMPRPKPPYPATKGYLNMPTVVNNAETLCNLPLILLHGAEWFQSLGNSFNSGTKLFSVAGNTRVGGVVEVKMGTSIQQVIDATNESMFSGELKAIQLGGPSGGFVPASQFDTPLDYYHLKQMNLYLGSGSFTVLNKNNCIVDVCKYFMEFIENESCGKCIPCREGSQRMSEIFRRIVSRPDDSEEFATLLRFKGVMQLEHMAGVMTRTSLCGLGQNAPGVVLSALKHFRNEFEEHIFERVCSADVCRNLKMFRINPENCTGCGICAKRCPVDAIAGSLKQVHYIVTERCIACGLCFDSCKFNAIIKN